MCSADINNSQNSKTLCEQLKERRGASNLSEWGDFEIICLVIRMGGGNCKHCDHSLKTCRKKNGSIRNFVSTPPEKLDEECRKCRARAFTVSFFQQVPQRYLWEKVLHNPLLKSSRDVFDYLYLSMRDLKKEVFKATYLNSRNEIIDTVDLFQGTTDSIPIAPREIMESAIKVGASAIVFAHNHPSGDPKPSQSDKQMTRDLVFIGNVMQIKILDHIIIGDNCHFSFANEGLIEKYEDAFINLKIKATLPYQVTSLKHCNPTKFKIKGEEALACSASSRTKN